MKRITISLPDHLAALLDYERRRRDVPASAVVREALSAMLAPEGDTELWFVGIGRSDYTDTARRWNDILDEEWTLARLKGTSPEEEQGRLHVAEDATEYDAGENG
jgi:hypothetical protein